MGPSGPTGRYLTVDLHDGRRVRMLHLSEILVDIGEGVSRGDTVARSGASRYGMDWGVGPHVHVTLFPGHSYDFGATIDFDAVAGGAAVSGGGANSLMAKGWDEMATKDEIKDAVREVIGERFRGAVVISYASDSFRNGIVLAGPGYWHTFTSEEFEHVYAWQPPNAAPIFAGVPVITPFNDRHYDIIRDVMTRSAAAVAPSVDVAALAAALAQVDHTASADDVQQQVHDIVLANTLPVDEPVSDLSVDQVVDFSNQQNIIE